MVGDAGLIRDEVVLRVELGGGGTRSPKENGDRNAGQEMRPHGLAPFSLRGPRRRSRSRPAAPWRRETIGPGAPQRNGERSESSGRWIRTIHSHRVQRRDKIVDRGARGGNLVGSSP